MKIISMAAASAAMALATIPFASPVAAQGTVAKMALPEYSSCPKGWQKSKRGSDTTFYCYPTKDSKPAYPKEGSTRCADGYEQQSNFCVKEDDESSRSSSSSSSSGAVYTPPTYGSIKKASAFDRCPVGYHTSEPDVMECVSYDYAAGKQPLTRAKKGKPCAADEVDEWGLWCTSKVTQLTRNEAEQEAVADVNHLFPRDGKGGNQGPDYKNTPGIVAIFGPEGAAPSANGASGAASSDDQAAAAPKTAQCTTDSGSATGAAIGGAVGGDAGAVLGGMLGGLGKKKKKTC
ncbi:hypothetical protein GVM20_03650 [Porphyrobacter sp. SLTP]|uniref:hypothetical protein n=1 Tax=Porphyrobacter sp. SLTP TaxID=2683266 RepID=UPI001412641F|nr:hypothetical protein [Porphyrobacter sp. SLTP]NBB24219.1 hypothetical protein [Porphyrobacter sp. SLTP]